MGCLPFSACLTYESRRSIDCILFSTSFESLAWQNWLPPIQRVFRSLLPGVPSSSFPNISSSGVSCIIFFLIFLWFFYVFIRIIRIDILYCMVFSTCISPNVVLRNLINLVSTSWPKHDLLVFQVYLSFCSGKKRYTQSYWTTRFFNHYYVL